MMTSASAANEIAYYYPEPCWLDKDRGWIKSLLLFFDEVAILLPEYMRDSRLGADPSLAEPLLDQGLLRVLEPEWFVDDIAARKLTDVITSLVEIGTFDGLADKPFGDLSLSRAGFPAAPEEAQRLLTNLAKRGLAARFGHYGESVFMHSVVRDAYLVVLAQLARETGFRHKLDLHPVTNNKRVAESFTEFLELGPMPSRGQVVSFDLEVVSVDLDNVPLYDILQFRDENRAEHRKYMQSLRTFAFELSMCNSADRRRALADRRAELKDEAHDLLRRSWQAFRSPRSITGFSLGLAGAAWSLAVGSPVPAVLTALGAGLGMLPSTADGGAYSYLFRASRNLQR